MQFMREGENPWFIFASSQRGAGGALDVLYDCREV